MWWWRRKVDLTVMPLREVDWAQGMTIGMLNNANAEQHVVPPLKPDEGQQLIGQALYANASLRLQAKSATGPLGFGVLTEVGQRGSYHSDHFARTAFGASNPATVWLDRIVVDAESRRRGLGRALLQDLCAKARELNFTHVACCIRFCGTAGIAFLKATGFVEVGKLEFRGPYGGVYYFYAMNLENDDQAVS